MFFQIDWNMSIHLSIRDMILDWIYSVILINCIFRHYTSNVWYNIYWKIWISKITLYLILIGCFSLIYLKPNIIWNSCKRYDLLWKRKISPTNLILTISHANVIVQMRGNKWNYSKNRNMWWQMHSHGCRRTKSQSSYFFSSHS